MHTVTRMMQVVKSKVIVNACITHDRCDGRCQGMLNRYPDELHSEGCGVKMTGSACACRGVVCWFGRWMYPTPRSVDSAPT